MPLLKQGFHLCQQSRPNFSRVARTFGAGLEVAFEMRPANLMAALSLELWPADCADTCVELRFFPFFASRICTG